MNFTEDEIYALIGRLWIRSASLEREVIRLQAALEARDGPPVHLVKSSPPSEEGA